MSVVNNENLIRQQLKILISGGSLQNSGADNLLYPPHDNVCNFFDAEYLLEPKKYIYNLSQLAYPVFPKNLPPVPERSDIVIKTDDPVPCDGIWEPVKIQYNHKLLVIKTDISGFKNLGAYNYFIRGMNAPRQVYYDVLIESDTEMVIPDDPIRYRDVHWRLVWEDTRYCDGIILMNRNIFWMMNQVNALPARAGSVVRTQGIGQPSPEGISSLLIFKREH